MSELTKTYEQIAIERDHICTGCGSKENLSHSHLIPRSRRPDLKAAKENIVYHCMSIGNSTGCHSQFESLDVIHMIDFKVNFAIIYLLDKEYFWLRVNKLKDFWEHRGTPSFMVSAAVNRINDLIKECESSI